MLSRSFAASWTRHSLFDLATWTNGLAFRDFAFSPSGEPVIKIAELKSGISEQTKYTQQTFAHDYRVGAGDLLFAWSGSPDTSIDVFRWRGPEGWLNQHIFKLQPSNAVDDHFFYYLLKYLRPTFVEIARNKQTTGLGHITIKDLKQLSVGVPDIFMQRAIAHILGTLDDKIDLNRRMNQTLEAIARALFQSWFVTFDPVRAKAAGRQPTGIDAETAKLFPSSFVDDGGGPTPEGWRRATIADIARANESVLKTSDPML